MKKLILIVSCISLVIWGVARIVKSEIVFERNCGGYLKRAADANTVDLAKKELTKVIQYCEINGLTSGYTSIIYRTPDEDIEFWYTNLKESLKELEQISEDATPLEKSNMLMKLRETILHNTDSGSSVTCPEGISIYPYNTGYIIWFFLSLFFIILFGMGVYNDY